MSNVSLMPGAERLIAHLRRHNIPMAIATGSTLESFRIKIFKYQQLFKIGDNFQHIVFTRDDPEVSAPKPAPDVYLVAAKRFKSSAESHKCLVFEDTKTGVDGAISAGMQCVMVPDYRFQYIQQNATQIIKTLFDFKPELYGLPPFED
ncbi:unnamed protein product [Medioppia subpectinata]|uniref:Uncharacterized protein n=1 Tax=Medioppia subpectinata TaxID=1979941 RepID=A0A7R9LH02_9ACAR|nr:unnamed protein product [Medioppia subpectinata]CAG2118391.1 unnamed protein product [Medioppia subpectinata]